MTTRVTITFADDPHDKDIIVDTVDHSDNAELENIVESVRLSNDGDDVSVYLYDNRTVRVREVEKE